MNKDQIEKNQARLTQLVKLALDEVLTPAYRDQVKLEAITKRSRFLALVEAGFSDAQALTIIVGKPND